jgi:minor extracellular serine protease Vpr
MTFCEVEGMVRVISGDALINDLYMYGDKLKASLIKGAGENVFTAFSRAVSENTSKNTKYPNPVTGWGTLCLLDSIP